MKNITTTIFVLFLFIGIANAQYLHDLQGKPLSEMSYTDVVGTPYLYDGWTKGTVELVNGTFYKDLDLKFSLLKDELFFKNTKDDAMLAFVLPVKSFLFEVGAQKNLYRNGFPEVDNFNKTAYYQVLFDGNLKLLFKSYKTISEIKPYNSATTEKRFADNYSYYVLKDGKMNKIRPSKKEFLELFKNKTAEIDQFIKTEKIDFKNNQDLSRMLEFYSAL